jgi:hypothetical protein
MFFECVNFRLLQNATKRLFYMLNTSLASAANAGFSLSGRGARHNKNMYAV